MSEKRFTIHKENMYKEDWYDYPFCIKEDGEVVLETIPLFIAEKVRDKLNEQQSTIKYLTIEKHQADKRFQTIIAELKKENEQLRKDKEQLKERLRECGMRLDKFNCR